MVYETSEGPRFLTGPLTDAQVPTVTFATQNRYVALANTDAQIFDTQTWTELTIPGARQIHDLNKNGIVATTTDRVLALTHQGEQRISLPLEKPQKTSPRTRTSSTPTEPTRR